MFSSAWEKNKIKSGTIFPVFWIGKICQTVFTSCSKICYKALCRYQEKLWGDWVAWRASINHRTKKAEVESGLQALSSGGPALPQHPAVPGLLLTSVVQADEGNRAQTHRAYHDAYSALCHLCLVYMWQGSLQTQWRSSSAAVRWRTGTQC